MKGDVVKSKDTKELLRDSLIELARKKPLDKITIKQVSENAGVTSQTFYNHFRDKYDMVLWAYRNRVDDVFIKEDGTSSSKRISCGHSSCDGVSQKPRGDK